MAEVHITKLWVWFLLLYIEMDVDIDDMSTRQTDQLNVVSSDYGISSGKFCRY